MPAAWVTPVQIVPPPAGEMTHFLGISGVTTTSARYRVRGTGTIQIETSPNSDLSGSTTSAAATLGGEATDYTGGGEITGLSVGTQYYYSIKVGGARVHSTPFPKFKTFPTADVDVTQRIIFSGDQFSPTDSPHVFAQIKADAPDLVFHLGDLGHPDVTVLEARRQNCKDQITGTFVDDVLTQCPWVNIYSDHDYEQGNSHGGVATRALAVQVYQEYRKGYDLVDATKGIYHSFKRGNVEFFMLDMRYNRESSRVRFPNSDQVSAGAPLTPPADTGSSNATIIVRSADLTPPGYGGSNAPLIGAYCKVTTVSGTYVRRITNWVLATRTMTLNQAVPDLAAGSTYHTRRCSILDKDNHWLSNTGQLYWLVNGVNNSTARWKVLGMEAIWNPSAGGSDRWADFDNGDRMEQMFIQQHITDDGHILVASADNHHLGCDDGTNSGYPEITVGPIQGPSYPVDGLWSQGSRSEPGYGIMDFDADEVTLTMKRASGTFGTPLTI